MLKTYKKIDHRIFGFHGLIKRLIVDIFCEADNQRALTKIKKVDSHNNLLERLYSNTRLKWFRLEVNSIYTICKKLKIEEKKALIKIFENNNRIEDLCITPSILIFLSELNDELKKYLIPFLKKLYSSGLSWSDVETEFGTKEDYYKELIKKNDLVSCPCCGFGSIKTIYEDGHSAFDHYLPLKYYPFSVVNFNNLFPLCSICNSDNKGEKDVLKAGKKIFYPASIQHPSISFQITVNTQSLLSHLLNKAELLTDNTQYAIKTVCDSGYEEELESWNMIFDIENRYLGQIKTNSFNWFNDVREKYRSNQKRGRKDSFKDAFDEVIEDDSNKHLGFLKAPFLKTLGNNSALLEALIETQDSSVISS